MDRRDPPPVRRSNEHHRHCARELIVGGPVVRAILIARVDTAAVENDHIVGEQRERQGAVAGGERMMIALDDGRDRRRVALLRWRGAPV